MKKGRFLSVLALLCVTLMGCNKDVNSSNPVVSNSVGGTTSSEPHPLQGQTVNIHYYRYDGEYDKWGLWLWEKGKDGAEYPFTGTDDFGGYAQISLTNWSKDVLTNGLGFIVKTKGSWSGKDIDSDRFVDFSKITRVNNSYNIYLKTGDETIYLNKDEVSTFDIISPRFTDSKTITFSTSGAITKYTIYEDDNPLLEQNVTTDDKIFTYKFSDDHPSDLTKTYYVEVTFKDEEITQKRVVNINSLYKDPVFAQFTYEGNDLGATYTQEKTTFKVWSPVSSEIKVRVYDSGTPKSVDSQKGNDTYVEHPMTKGDKGVFSAEVSSDLGGKYYTYVVTNGQYKEKEIVDPYAKSAGINGLRGMIVDFSKTNPEGWDEVTPHKYDRKELVVYETHVSDLSSSKTWSSREEDKPYAKKFKGAYTEGTTYTKDNVTVKTGFDNIKELGVNAVQFVPIFDQENDETKMTFNWGYNPLNYNVLEGSYSTDPYDGYNRIKEFKELVQAYNKADINVIMDVVYNHVSNAIGSNFDVLMPGYYFRYSGNSLANGSGCGNETASEMPMFRKFMKDSTEFLAKEYKLGGFRFDLMALHDLDTMKELVANLKTFNPNICVYGEPWTGGTSPLNPAQQASQANGAKYDGYGQFNDQMRDALIKGGMSGVTEKGFVNSPSKISDTNLKSIEYGIKGFTNDKITDPNKTVNYVTCHDNYTLFDRMRAADSQVGLSTARFQSMLANSIVFTSQGTTFMLAGEEFSRTKGGDHNSYQSSYEVNELNYDLKITNKKMFENYKKLIELKTTVDGLKLESDACKALTVTVTENQIKFDIKDTKNNKIYRIVHNNGVGTPATVDFMGYTLYLDTYLGNDNNTTLSSATQCKAYQTIIGVKNA